MENPELLFGIPLIALGAFGLFIAIAAFAAPADDAAGAGGALRLPMSRRAAGAHPSPNEYVIIGITLAFITLIEVALYYIDLNQQVLIVLLVLLSALKFGLVISWFMHLRFDAQLFSVLFLTGLGLAFAVFTVIIATLGGNLI